MFGRYFYFESNGSNKNVGNHLVEVQIFDKDGVNQAFGKGILRGGGSSSSSAAYITDGITTTDKYLDFGSGKQYVVIDLGDVYDIASIKVWRYYSDGRYYKDVFVKVSVNDISYKTVFSSAVNGTYTETADGYTIELPLAAEGETYDPDDMGYRRVKYIKSSGSQYINTGILSTSDVNYEVEFMDVESAGSYHCIIGSTGYYNSFYPYCDGKFDYVAYCYNKVEYKTLSKSLQNIKCTINKTGNVFKLSYDGTVITMTASSSDSFTRTNNMLLFAMKSGIDYAYARLYRCRIWNGEELVRDYIPVLDLDDVPCLFDRVTKTYFYNQGTGSFIAGEEMLEPVYFFDGKTHEDAAWVDTIKSKSMTAAKGSFIWEDDCLVVTKDVNYFNLPTDYGSYGTFEVLVKIDKSFVPISNSNWYNCSCIFGCELSGQQRDWGLIIDSNGYFAIGYGFSSIASTDIKANDSQWHTATMVVGSSYMNLYIDGVLKKSVTITMSGTAISTFGVGWNKENSTKSVTGHIGTVKVWNSALTDSDIYTSYGESLEWLGAILPQTYAISYASLKAFGDQARRISGETGKLSIEQMLAIFTNAN